MYYLAQIAKEVRQAAQVRGKKWRIKDFLVKFSMRSDKPKASTSPQESEKLWMAALFGGGGVVNKPEE